MKAASRFVRRVSRVTLTTALLCLSLSCSEDDPVRPTTDTPASADYDVSIVSGSFNVWSIAASSSGNVYAGGEMLLHYDGSTWSPLPFPREYAISVLALTLNGDLYALGSNASRFNGETWSEMAAPDMSDAFIAYNGEIFGFSSWDSHLHWFDGITWRSKHYPNAELRDIDGTGPDNVVVAGHRGAVARFDGTSWIFSNTDSTIDFRACGAAPDNQHYLVSWYDSVYVWDGASLSFDEQASNPGLFRLKFGASGNAYSLSVRSNGSSFRQRTPSGWEQIVLVDDRVRDFVETDDGAIFLASNDRVWKLEGTSLREEFKTGEDERIGIRGACAIDDLGVLTTGREVWHYKNGQATNLGKDKLTTRECYSIYASSADDVYSVGPDMILHYDGSSWAYESGGGGKNLADVWCRPDYAVAVGSDGTLLEKTGDLWQQIAVNTEQDINAVSGWHDGAVAVGDGGLVIMNQGGVWTRMTSPASWHFRDVWAEGPNDVYVCGWNYSRVLHYDGRTWSAILTGIPDDRFGGGESIAVLSRSELFLSLTDGRILHKQGEEWEVLPRYMDDYVKLAVLNRNDLYGAGFFGLLRYTRKGF